MKQLLLAILLTAFTVSSSQAQFAGGLGTEVDPYHVSTVEQLQEMRNHLDKHFIQIADIDASETVNWNDGMGFEPIGDDYLPFTGSYDGGEYIISRLSINLRDIKVYVGLFGYAKKSELRSVKLEDISISGLWEVGGLVGYNEGGTIINSTVSGSLSGSSNIGGLVGSSARGGEIFGSSALSKITGEGHVGGLVGYNESIISNSYANFEITSDGFAVGGISGSNFRGKLINTHAIGVVNGQSSNVGGLTGMNIGEIEDSFAEVDINGSEWVGGLVGYNGQWGTILNSYSTGEVSGINNVGGLIGMNTGNTEVSDSYSTGNVNGENTIGGLVGNNNHKGIIVNSYSTGKVSGINYVGGLIGTHVENAQVSNSYSTGKVTGDQNLGGLIGINGASVDLSYWDIESSEINNGVGGGSNSGIYGLNTPQMNGIEAFFNMEGFDFYNSWVLTNEYPALYWQDVEIILPPPPVVDLINPENEQIDVPLVPTLSWRANQWTETYQIQLSSINDFTSIILDDETPDTFVTIHEPLNTNSLYYWRVRSFNQSGESDWSEVWRFKTLDLPEVVSLLYPDDYMLVIGQTVQATWNPSQPNIQTYHVELAVDGDFNSVILETTVNETSFSFDGLDHKQQYWWRVKAENSVGIGQVSETSTFYAANFESVSTSGEIVSGVSQFTSNVFFTSSMDDRVYSFDRNGNVLWTVETGGELQSTVSVNREGISFVGSTDTRLYAFNKDGIPLWDRALGGTIRSSPSIGNNNAVYVGISTGRFFAFSKGDGDILWSVQTGGAVLSSASINSDGTIYFGSNDGKLYAVTSVGDLLWSFETDGAIEASPALTIGGEVVIPSTDGYIYKINSEGEIIWRFETGGAIRTSPVIDSEGIIYFGSGDGSVYAIDKDGLPVWEYKIGSPVNGTPALSQNGYLCIGSDNGRFYLIDEFGELVWFLQTGAAIVAPALITSDLSIFISSKDGKVYIVEDMIPQTMNKGQVADVSVVHEWSTFKGSNRRTGNQEDVFDVSAGSNEVDYKEIPSAFELQQNYPNPFNPSTIISYSVPEQSHIRLEVFNSLGQRVAILVDDTKSAGRYEVSFDATGLSSGLYLYRLRTDLFVESRQMMLVK